MYSKKLIVMTCNLNNCTNKAETEDGFCCKHGYYSSTSEKHITMHVKKYLDQIYDLKGKKNKTKKMINLWYYLTHKKDFILKNNNFHKTILAKAEEIQKDLVEYNFIKELEKFNNLHDQIKSFKN